MLIMNHVLSGAILGTLAPNVPTAAITGFASHFVLDSIPHWGDAESFEAYRKVAIRDGVVGLVFSASTIAVSAKQDRPKVVAGIFGACLPDTDKPLDMFFGHPGHPKWFIKLHQKIQTEDSFRMKQEWLVAAGLLGVFAATVVGKHWYQHYRKAEENIEFGAYYDMIEEDWPENSMVNTVCSCSPIEGDDCECSH